MQKIRILDEHVANQIAAGEVVERPASVVKELVENAIDAGSSVIEVEVEEGGLQSIRITDNGCGMNEQDCQLAFQRHATSKIMTGRDLFRIQTLGFRGEALPSIAAVSKIELITSPDETGLATRIVVEGGKVKQVEACSGRRGTHICVNELFYNTPARLKYMKSIQTELSHISDYMYRLSLARPDISFELRHNGKRLLRSPGNEDRLQVIAAIYGTAAAKQMLRLEANHPDYTMRGFISKPELTRASKTAISFIVNQRYVRHFLLTKALLEGYHTLLPLNRYPIAVIDLQMDPALVDVNVHPAKLDVRFSKEKELLHFIEQNVRDVLQQEVLIPNTKKKEQKRAIIQEQLSFQNHASVPADIRDHMFTDHVTEVKQRKSLSDDHTENGKHAINDGKQGKISSTFHSPSVQEEDNTIKEKAIAYSDHKRMKNRTRIPMDTYQQLYQQSKPTATSTSFPKLYPIGQMRGTYIIAQNEDGLFFIDQHAAHERIHYEYFYDKFGQPATASQEFLVPMTIELTAAESEVISDKLHWLEQCGVYLEPFGGSTYRVTACPHWFPKGEEEPIIREMIDWIIQEKGSIDIAKLREKASILCSCKASIKANQPLNPAEIETLLERLAQCRTPYTCPHGRPVIVSFSNYELEKMFKRA